MLQLCGRYQIDTERFWDMTPSEFFEVVDGAKQAERMMRLGFAGIISTVLAFGGKSISPEALIGEEKDYGEDPFGGSEDKQARFARMREALAAASARAHREWMPEGIGSDEVISLDE